ncbi:hypothetical protein BCR36DRAFT_361182 [Piromyces finnis]|uniref:G-protein coupled receptors family 1 profile domain-containing protein n=1 Tax=Piromyces finnis TaxID=1754191 RepID=A0A1Y1UYD3_9FUNG|nr:hypothetical protein BCR36DRAFT_361182 [Piromyces finnis]|eukprot:ORX43437.1 hypothetical protein BCR36DRAFT_361182 [Piromyces finnis]
MIEKQKALFNTTHVPHEEFQKYKQSGFLNSDDFKIEKYIYFTIFVIYNIFFIASLIFYYKIRESGIVIQRGFGLSFFGGIITFLNAFFGFIPQFMKVSCPLSVYNANVLNVLVNLIFFCRTLSLVLQHYFKKSFLVSYHDVTIPHDEKKQEITIRKKANRVIYAILFIPTVISFIVTVSRHAQYYDKCRFFEYKDAMIELKNNNGKELFIMVQIFGGLYTFLSLIMTILLSFVKDANKYGAKFEMLSSCILIFIANIVNIVLQIVATGGQNELNNTKRHRFILTFFEITKGGKMLFVFLSIYMLFTSISLPVIQFYRKKTEKVKDTTEYEALQ